MRLFTGFYVPSGKLIEIQKKIAFEGIKLVKDFHCTLKFLGEVDDADSVAGKLKGIKFKKFPARFSKTGAFPNLEYVKVIWAGLEPCDKISKLHDAIEKVLDNFGKDKDYAPHVTIGRVRFVKDKELLRKAINEAKVDDNPFLVDKFFLMESVLKPSGPEYRVVEEFNLV